jgi:hypothetical protein
MPKDGLSVDVDGKLTTNLRLDSGFNTNLTKISKLTVAQYEALKTAGTVDPDTIYFVIPNPA